MKRYVIVTGIPASGKSTIGRSLATALGLPMLDKDEILEALFKTRGVGDAPWRMKLSRMADDALQERAMQVESAVITSWWRHPDSRVDSGTPAGWLLTLPGTLIELHCICGPEIAAKRFVSRKRHEGHLDKFRSYAELLESFQQQAALGPLGVGRLVNLNTEGNVELAIMFNEIELASSVDCGRPSQV
jgi:adenylate kinase